MPRDDDNELTPILIGTDSIPVGEVREFETFDEAVRALMLDLEPGQSIDIHHEDCGLNVSDGEESCTCTPLRLGGGAQA
jgi:hypothetical protein